MEVTNYIKSIKIKLGANDYSLTSDCQAQCARTQKSETCARPKVNIKWKAIAIEKKNC